MQLAQAGLVLDKCVDASTMEASRVRSKDERAHRIDWGAYGDSEQHRDNARNALPTTGLNRQ